MSDSNQHQLVVTLRADWGIGPLWVAVDDDFPVPYDTDGITEVLALSGELWATIAAWDERFQNTYNDMAPQDSGIRDPVERAAFMTDGRELARRIKSEAPANVRVRYEDVDGGQWEPER